MENKNQARLIVDRNFIVDIVDKRLYGTFIEPIGNIIYGNLYNPDHPTADKNGYRKDVMTLMKELGTTLIRFPGGNYVSGYNWVDGIGPKEKRPVRFDKAWRQIDTNQMGIDEYVDYNKLLGVENMLAVNLGTGTPEEAANEVEYCNMKEGTYWSDLRKKYGHPEPHNIKLWCLGNEMDGFWQIEQKTPEDYGKKAREAAKLMKMVDPEIELVVCGSCTNEKGMETYPEWDRMVLDYCYDYVDYISLHRYYSYDPDVYMAFDNPFTIEDLPAIAGDLNDYLDTVLAAADFIKGKKRSNKKLHISFDEWGVQTSIKVQPKGLNWQPGPSTKRGARVTNVVDAVLFGSLLITFLNRCDRVKIACQSIVIGSMIAASPDGGAYRQSTFYPFKQVATYGHGMVLKQNLDSPLLETANFGQQKSVQSAVVYNEEEGIFTVFAVNLDLRNSVDLSCKFLDFAPLKLVEHLRIWDEQPLAGNTFDQQNRIVPHRVEVNQNQNTATLLPLSWNVLRFQIEK